MEGVNAFLGLVVVVEVLAVHDSSQVNWVNVFALTFRQSQWTSVDISSLFMVSTRESILADLSKCAFSIT